MSEKITEINFKIIIKGDLQLFELDESDSCTDKIFATHEESVEKLKTYLKHDFLERFRDGEMDELLEVHEGYSLFEGKDNVKIEVI